MHLQPRVHLTLTNFQRLYLYTSDSYISFPLNRHVRLHKLLGQPSNLEDDPKTIGFSQIYEECWKRGHFSFPGYRGDRWPVVTVHTVSCRREEWSTCHDRSVKRYLSIPVYRYCISESLTIHHNFPFMGHLACCTKKIGIVRMIWGIKGGIESSIVASTLQEEEF